MNLTWTQRYPKVAMTVVLAAIIALFLYSLNLGMIAIAPLDVFKTLVGKGTEEQAFILFEFRLPRMVIALLIGVGLAIAGAILQGVSQNGLADPGILGINSGAGVAVVGAMVFWQSLASEYVLFIPLVALVGALVAATLIYLFAWKGGVTPTRLILVGVGINALFGAALIILQLKMDPRDFSKATIWLTGSIWGTDWTFVRAVLPWIIILVPIVLWKARVLNALQLGDKIAFSQGVHVERERLFLVLLCVALAGACVAVGGGISFIGLVAPHLARRIVGARHEVLLPFTALIGAFLLLLADTLGKHAFQPTEVSVGIVIAIIGAPYFLYLLIRSKH